MKPIKQSIFLSVEKIIYYDLENLDNFYVGSLNNLDSLSNLSILTRSLIEMSFVMSGYFYKDDYEKDKKEINLTVNPKDIFGYIYKSAPPFGKSYSVLDFSSTKPIHSFGKLNENWTTYKNKTKGKLPIAIQNTKLNDIYLYYLENNNIYNKIIHRYWSIPSKDIEIINTKFYESFSSINNYISQSFEIIYKQIELFLEWVDSPIDDPEDVKPLAK